MSIRCDRSAVLGPFPPHSLEGEDRFAGLVGELRRDRAKVLEIGLPFGVGDDPTSTFHFLAPVVDAPVDPVGVRFWIGVSDACVVAHGELAHPAVAHERCGGFVELLDIEPITHDGHVEIRPGHEAERGAAR